MVCKSNGAIAIFRRNGLQVNTGDPLIDLRYPSGTKSYTGHNIGFIETVDDDFSQTIVFLSRSYPGTNKYPEIISWEILLNDIDYTQKIGLAATS